jgi:hypothetical protein
MGLNTTNRGEKAGRQCSTKNSRYGTEEILGKTRRGNKFFTN